jgi:hypothetical protein
MRHVSKNACAGNRRNDSKSLNTAMPSAPQTPATTRENQKISMDIQELSVNADIERLRCK